MPLSTPLLYFTPCISHLVVFHTYFTPFVTHTQVVEELFTYWKLDEADEYLEELEEALIVRYTEGNLLRCLLAGGFVMVFAGCVCWVCLLVVFGAHAAPPPQPHPPTPSTYEHTEHTHTHTTSLTPTHIPLVLHTGIRLWSPHCATNSGWCSRGGQTWTSQNIS